MAYVPVDIPVAPGTMLSDGTINATIHTYKPPSISIPFTISIIHEDDIIATIGVEENSGSTPMYKLRGNSRSLQLFNMLCNIDITDKSPYLMFNGEAATLPKGFEVTQTDGTKFIPPPPPRNKASNRFIMESMMEAVEEAARQPAGSGAADGPPKTIFLLVSMHGARLETMPLSMDLPINETYAYAPGECPKLKVSTLDQLARIQKYRGLYIDDIAKEYFKDFPTDAKEMRPYSVLYDQHYQCDFSNSANTFSNGIFILGSNFLESSVLDPIVFDVERMEVEYGQFHPKLYETKSAMELQKINLINIEVLEKLSTIVTGEPFALEQKRGDLFSRNKKDTGLPHYFDSQLSHYLRYCQKLGAEKVVVIDETCRIRSFRSGVGNEEAAAAVEKGFVKPTQASDPNEMRDSVRKGDYGGRRTRRRRRRSRRSHKKS